MCGVRRRGGRPRDADPPDAVLLDVEMPELDGPATFLPALRAEPACAQVPVLFLTAHDDRAELARLGALGAAGVLAKLFALDALAGEVAGALGWAA